jgi:GTP cyclohydrolase I
VSIEVNPEVVIEQMLKARTIAPDVTIWDLMQKVTPSPTGGKMSIDDAGKMVAIQEHFAAIYKTLGMDLENPEIKDTPARVAKMYVQELFRGLDWTKFPKMTATPNDMKFHSMVHVGEFQVKTVCAHHIQPIFGTANIAYVPKDRLLGLSKFARLTDFFSRRPQVQELLTKQVSEAARIILGTEDVAVYMNLEHGCMRFRGVEDPTSTTTTCELHGLFFDDPRTRSEFYSQMALQRK